MGATYASRTMPDLFYALLIALTLDGCSKPTEDRAPPEPTAAASEAALQERPRAEVEDRKRAEALQKKADKEATRLALADEAEAEAKARTADQHEQPFRGKLLRN
jgi:hypothetical protein